MNQGAEDGFRIFLGEFSTGDPWFELCDITTFFIVRNFDGPQGKVPYETEILKSRGKWSRF